MHRIAVIGSGIAGLAAAHGLSRDLAGQAQTTLFEAGSYFGGHSNTVDVTLDGVTHGVDTGFLVLNERTYPQLLALFRELNVGIAPSEMSFSVQVPASEGRRSLEWSGSNLDSLFAQRRNVASPAFWRMLRDLLRFNRITTALAVSADSSNSEQLLDQSIADFLAHHRFSDEFRDWYFLPMIGCIWSCPVDQMLRFPIATMIRFCHNHGLLQIANRPQWYTVRGGSRNYVRRMLASIPDARLNTPVRRVFRGGASTHSSGRGVWVSTDSGTQRFDAVVMACHSDQALALLADPTPEEQAVLGAIRYQANRAVLHTDASLMPTRRRAWAAWNYERAPGNSASASARGEAAVCLHYWLNVLQPLPFRTPLFVSLNPHDGPREDSVHARFEYSHPVFDRAAIAAQERLPALQGQHDTWFCGAWTGYGFHEDGLRSGLAARDAVLARLSRMRDASDNGATSREAA